MENPRTESNQEQTPQTDEHTLFENRIDLSELQQAVLQIKEELAKVIVGQKAMVDMLITALLTGGHVLIEGVPGIAKTITAKLLAKNIDVQFKRIQFTPDLMPSDILGTSIFDLKKSTFEFKKGPVFTNILLIDEINRAPAKTQAALFEVMEEKQLTIDGNTYQMASPFTVLATQNPIEHEGTYRLPEAQLDRFLFKIEIDYPSLEDEIEIINREHDLKQTNKLDKINRYLSGEKVAKFQELIHHIVVAPDLIQYIATIVHQTRSHELLYMGASPRASIAILKASKAFAATRGRDFVTPEDIKSVAHFVLPHRIIITPEKEMEGITAKQIITQIINTIEVPR